VAYTVQTTVDALHNIPIDFKESNLLKQYPKHCAAILLLVAVILSFLRQQPMVFIIKISNRLYLL
jgi:hypothetical protein